MFGLKYFQCGNIVGSYVSYRDSKAYALVWSYFMAYGIKFFKWLT